MKPESVTSMVVILFSLMSVFGQRTDKEKRPRRAMSAEKVLVHQLLADYDDVGVIGRPTLNLTSPVHVHFGLGLIQMEVEEKENMLRLSAWTKYSWVDEYLKWDPADYDNVTSIKLPHDRIWTPDIMLYNTANTATYSRHALVVVTPDGDVSWYPHRLFLSSCSIDVTYFPFDNQTCHLFFGSWTHTISELNVSLAFPGGIDLSTFDDDYNRSSKWWVQAAWAERLEPQGYAVLAFHLHLKRKMMFSSYILTVPAVFLSFLTLVVFALPSEHVEKSQLGLAIFGSLLLLLLIVVEAAPPTASAVPLLGIFYCFTTVVVILSVFLTSVVIKLANAANLGGPERRVPAWAKMLVFGILGRLLCVSRCREMCQRRRYSSNLTYSELAMSGVGNGSTVQLQNHMSETPTNQAPKDAPSEVPPMMAKSELSQYLHTLCQSLVGIHHQLQDRETELHRERQTEEEWRLLASVLDRLFFWLYLIAIILSMVFLFPWV